MDKGCRYGTHRVITPEGTLPQPALKLDNTMSIYDNVIAGYKLNGISLPKQEKDQLVEESLKNVGLWDEVKDSLFKKGTFLSGGQQQRAAIGRALITRPALILADEPTGNLDTQNSSEVIALLKEASKKYEQTIIMITHNRSIAQTADRVLQVSDGVLTDFGRCRE